MAKLTSDQDDAAKGGDTTSPENLSHDFDLVGAARARLAAMAGMRRILEELDQAIEAGHVEKAKALMQQVQRAVDAASHAEENPTVRISEIRYVTQKDVAQPGATPNAKTR